jgi:hypothetical protein
METEKLGTKDVDGHQHWRARMIAGDGRDVVFTTTWMGMGMRHRRQILSRASQ